MRFARWTFALAGIYGLLAMMPMYFLESRIGRDNPPAITHPEYFYGFVGICIAWQVAFLIIASNPSRYRPLIVAAVIEKLAFAIAVPILYFQDRVSTSITIFSDIDTLLAVLFIISYVLLGRGRGRTMSYANLYEKMG